MGFAFKFANKAMLDQSRSKALVRRRLNGRATDLYAPNFVLANFGRDVSRAPYRSHHEASTPQILASGRGHLSLRRHNAHLLREKQTIDLLKFDVVRYRKGAGSLRGVTMVTKPRPWTATEIHRLKGLAKKKYGVSKIARSLKRTTAATAVKARALGIPLDARA